MIMSTPADLSQDFATMVANTEYDNLPANAIEGAKKSILDTIGVILGASGVEPAVRSVAELVRKAGGTPESSVLGFGGRAPALWASFANGAMAHCLDFDDHAPEGHHPSSAIVPAVLALAERAGGVSGREMIAAVAAGQEVFLRLRRNVESRKDWHLTTILGVFGAAARGAHRAVSAARKRTIAATSSGISAPGRHCDLAISTLAAASTHSSTWRCVITQPGVTVLTRMPCLPKSRARLRVSPITAALVVA
jgi:2-methylcitrate dehydratase PrpD